MTTRINQIAPGIYDELIALRTELLLEPTNDGSPSIKGKVIFHTRWVHYRDGVRFTEWSGPRIEKSFDDIIDKTYEVPVGVDAEGNPIYMTVPVMLVLGTIKIAYQEITDEFLAGYNPPAYVGSDSVLVPPSLPNPVASTPPPAYDGTVNTPTDT